MKFLFPFLILLFSSLCLVHPIAIDASPFSFLRDLQGCHKGETVPGLNELRTYLKNFGYLNSDQTQNNDKFDDDLEQAIETYQQNFRLDVTGTLDASTVEMMMTPRCGMPDIVDGTNEMVLHPNVRWIKHLGLHISIHYSFFPGKPKWPPSKYNLTYKFLNNFFQPTITNIAVSVFSKWASVSKFTFRLVPSTSSADLTIGGYAGNHGDGNSFDGPGGVLAHAFSPTSGRLHFDNQEMWSTNPSSSQIDLESVFIHEVGHLLGLGHSQYTQAIMYPSISYGVQKRTLQSDDIAGIQALYP